MSTYRYVEMLPTPPFPHHDREPATMYIVSASTYLIAILFSAAMHCAFHPRQYAIVSEYYIGACISEIVFQIFGLMSMTIGARLIFVPDNDFWFWNVGIDFFFSYGVKTASVITMINAFIGFPFMLKKFFLPGFFVSYMEYDALGSYRGVVSCILNICGCEEPSSFWLYFLSLVLSFIVYTGISMGICSLSISLSPRQYDRRILLRIITVCCCLLLGVVSFILNGLFGRMWYAPELEIKLKAVQAVVFYLRR